MIEKPKARLTIEQHQQAINEAIWIDASPHEWPTIDKMWLLCSALIDSVQMVDYLRARLAAVEAERDAAQKRVQDCETRMMRYAIELAEMQAERNSLARKVVELRMAIKEVHDTLTPLWRRIPSKTPDDPPIRSLEFTDDQVREVYDAIAVLRSAAKEGE